jgi:hypothetical protein
MDAVVQCPAEGTPIEDQATTRVVDADVARADAADTGVPLVRQHGLGGGRAKENRTWEEMGSCAVQACRDWTGVETLPGRLPVLAIARMARREVKSEEVRTGSALLDQRSAQTLQLQRERNAQCGLLGGWFDALTWSRLATVCRIREGEVVAPACRVRVSDVLELANDDIRKDANTAKRRKQTAKHVHMVGVTENPKHAPSHEVRAGMGAGGGEWEQRGYLWKSPVKPRAVGGLVSGWLS